MAEGKRILIAEDDPSVRGLLKELVSRWGFEVAEAADGLQACKMLESYRPDILLLDIKMPKADGLAVLGEIRSRQLPIATIIISGEGGVRDAVRAVKLGAEDYLEKPVEPNHLKVLLRQTQERLAEPFHGSAWRRPGEGPIIGQSLAVQQVMEMIGQVAPTQAPVIILGESGTGKELVARTIHSLSPRGDGPYLGINCAALPANLIESELFGHEKGAFTGAEEARQGCFELARDGTLLLDEFTEMRPELQAKLLRVIEERKLRRVGGNREVPLDVRVLAASNCDIGQALSEGRLREDLYYRLSVFTIIVPPLRERADDIPVLTQSFIQRFAAESHRPITGADEECLIALQSYPWPGNIRQLRNVIQRAVALSPGPNLRRSDLPAEFQHRASSGASFQVRVGATLEEVEQDLIARTIAAFRGNKTRAAKALGISLRTLYNRLAHQRTNRSSDKDGSR
ncbi:MAG: sigma-54-dependent transcriptional regulator [Candidatus Binataceae bacterium]